MTKVLCGIDEVGRGPLAGPVTAAAVILPDQPDFLSALDGLNDSKKLSAKKRTHFFDLIMGHCDVGIGHASVEEIDTHNILQATFIAMKRAVEALPEKPTHALIDGNRVPAMEGIECTPIIGGDAIEPCIMAASVVAKVTRDRLMIELAQDHPYYGWERNAGYGTKAHLEGLQSHGVTQHHRRSFAPIKRALQKVA